MSMSSGTTDFGWDGWVLVATLLVALIVIPALIILRPPTEISFRFAYLILPTIPAIALGVVAVWVALRSN